MSINKFLAELNVEGSLSQKCMKIRDIYSMKGSMREKYSAEDIKEFRALEKLYDIKAKTHCLNAIDVKNFLICTDLDCLTKIFAEKWKMQKEDVLIQYQTEIDEETTFDKAQEIAKMFNKEKDNSKDFLKIYFRFEGVEKAYISYFFVPLNLKQKDGKTLAEHLKPEVNRIDPNRSKKILPGREYEVKVKIDDLDNLIVGSPLNKLVRYDSKTLNFVPIGDFSKAVLMANEEYLNNQFKDEITEEK